MKKRSTRRSEWFPGIQLAVGGWLLVSILISVGAAATGPMVFIVHPEVPISEISAEELSEMFLKKTVKWANGSAVKPVEPNESHFVREQAARFLHSRELLQIQSYWQRQIFFGRTAPPRSFHSQKDLIDYVASTPGAVGYVSAETPIEGTVRRLVVGKEIVDK